MSILDEDAKEQSARMYRQQQYKKRLRRNSGPQKTHEELEADTAVFLAGGGVIQSAETGATGQNYLKASAKGPAAESRVNRYLKYKRNKA